MSMSRLNIEKIVDSPCIIPNTNADDKLDMPKGMTLGEVQKLHHQGDDAWNVCIAEFNAWIAENPDHRSVNVDFSYVNFSDFDFSRVDWGVRENCPTNFCFRKFPQKGAVDFDSAIFGIGNVSFREVEFGDGDVDFDNAIFGDGDVSFHRAEFGDGRASFWGATFGNGNVFFKNAKFGDGYVSFQETNFGDGGVSFRVAEFGKGSISFHGAIFGDGEVTFDGAEFGEGGISFKYVIFGGRVIFTEFYNIETITAFSFQYANLKGGIAFDPSRKGKFNCVPNFTGSHILGHFSTSLISLNEKNILTEIKTKQKQSTAGNIKEIADTSRALCRLKELAENSSEHKQVTDYWALEMQVNNFLEHKELKHAHALQRRLPIFKKELTTIQSKFATLSPESVDFQTRRSDTNTNLNSFQNEFPTLHDKLRPIFNDEDTDIHHKFSAIQSILSAKQVGFWGQMLLYVANLTLWGKTLLLRLYALLSNYGRSIGRPFLWLVGLWVIGAAIYYCATVPLDISDAALCSLSNTLPKFITPDLGLAENSCDGVIAWDVFQTLLSFILLFLFGLGVRNRFRI